LTSATSGTDRLRSLRKRKESKPKQNYGDYGHLAPILHSIFPSIVVTFDFCPFTRVLHRILRSLTRKVRGFKATTDDADLTDRWNGKISDELPAGSAHNCPDLNLYLGRSAKRVHKTTAPRDGITAQFLRLFDSLAFPRCWEVMPTATGTARTRRKSAFSVFYWLEVADFGLAFLFLFLWSVLHVTVHLFVVHVWGWRPLRRTLYKMF
jgi:hypothetical protein